MAAWRYEISLLVLKKYFTRSLRSLVKYFSTLEEKFHISARPCNILYIIFIFLDGLCWKKRIQVGHTAEQCILYEPLNCPNTEHVVTESYKYNIYHS